MGKGIANWLLYRDAGGLLSLTSLVLPAGVATPVHDHLAWGMVGLFSGEQEEEDYETGASVHPGDRQVDMRLVAKNQLQAGFSYELVPPTGDIHRVVTTGNRPSISIHLLSNDVGCVMRHRFEPATGEVAPFLTGYTNMPCEG